MNKHNYGHVPTEYMLIDDDEQKNIWIWMRIKILNLWKANDLMNKGAVFIFDKWTKYDVFFPKKWMWSII